MTREEAKGNLIHAIRWNDMPNKEALNMAIKALEQQSCEDCVSREALLAMSDYIGETPTHSNPYAQIEEVVRVKDIEALPSVSPKYNTSEWCHDCSEYDQDKHCCPRFNRVIRNAVEEVKKPKTGHWIYDKRIENWKCSECGCSPKTIGYVGHAEFMREHFKYCNHCGVKMEKVEESLDEFKKDNEAN